MYLIDLCGPQFLSDVSAGDASMAPIRLPLNLNNTGIKAEVKTEIKGEVAWILFTFKFALSSFSIRSFVVCVEWESISRGIC